MGKRKLNLNPSRVHQTAARLINIHGPTMGMRAMGAAKNTLPAPPWLTTVVRVPPSEILTRTQPMQTREIPKKHQTKKPSKLFRPQIIAYEEDKLRQGFFGDHPWELARPRVILEEDGKDGQRCDWSKIQQPGRQLNGESVVQRQLWLLHNVQGMTSQQAYDQARREFYAIRHEEEVERRVSKEEALSTGAYFGASRLDISMKLEDETFEAWKETAKKEVMLIEQQNVAAYTGFDEGDTASPAGETEKMA